MCLHRVERHAGLDPAAGRDEEAPQVGVGREIAVRAEAAFGAAATTSPCAAVEKGVANLRGQQERAHLIALGRGRQPERA